MTDSSTAALHQQVAGTFVGPVAPPPGQPSPLVVPMDWGAYDVPRFWTMLRHEETDENGIAFGQARGFENLAQLMLSHHDSLNVLAKMLAISWDPQRSAASARFFEVFDGLVRSMADDAVAHSSTARGLDGLLTALKSAKTKMETLKKDWDRVTTDWKLEWWDHAAQEVNDKARRLVAETDQAVGDNRRRMIVPAPYVPPQPKSDNIVIDIPSGNGSGSGGSGHNLSPTVAAPPPPVPGYNPIAHSGPDLQGLPNLPQPVPAIPGTPISVLPIPPGNPYAPGGGAFVLPGPGIGRGGWIYPMPTPLGSGTGVGQGRGRGASGGAVAPGMMPYGAAGAGRRNDSRRAGSRDLIWQVAQGGPPVIGELPHEKAKADQHKKDLDDTFVQWFADLATPWDKDMKANLGQPEATR